MTYGRIIRELRQENNLTQKELAEKIGYSKAIIGFWENEKNEPTISALVMLSKVFNVSIDYLAGNNEL